MKERSIKKQGTVKLYASHYTAIASKRYTAA